MSVRFLSIILAAASLLLASCSSPTLQVKKFELRNDQYKSYDEPLVRMEKNSRLYGAVDMKQKAQRLGQYYTVQWNLKKDPGTEPIEITFYYQQGQSNEKVKALKKTFRASETRGTTEFYMRGEDYKKEGRVLAWKTILTRGNRVVATRQSYLWE